MADYVLQLKNINKYFGKSHVIKNVNLSFERGHFITFLGPSGCGKTTLLRMIAGFYEPDEGEILLNGKNVERIPPLWKKYIHGIPGICALPSYERF